MELGCVNLLLALPDCSLADISVFYRLLLYLANVWKDNGSDFLFEEIAGQMMTYSSLALPSFGSLVLISIS